MQVLRVPVEEAMNYVGGYTIINNVSARGGRRTEAPFFLKPGDEICVTVRGIDHRVIR